MCQDEALNEPPACNASSCRLMSNLEGLEVRAADVGARSVSVGAHVVFT